MIKKVLKIIAYIPVSLFIPSVALAQGLIPPTRPAGLPGSSGNTVSDTVLLLIDLALAVVGIVAVAFLIYGGFLYITSAGNEETAGEAKRIILNSIIGLVVIILSYVIVTVIINALARGSV